MFYIYKESESERSNSSICAIGGKVKWDSNLLLCCCCCWLLPFSLSIKLILCWWLSSSTILISVAVLMLSVSKHMMKLLTLLFLFLGKEGAGSFSSLSWNPFDQTNTNNYWLRLNVNNWTMKNIFYKKRLQIMSWKLWWFWRGRVPDWYASSETTPTWWSWSGRRWCSRFVFWKIISFENS